MGQERRKKKEKRYGKRREYVLRKHGIGDFVEFETGKGAPRLKHAVCLVEDIRDRGDVPDPKRDGVEIVSVVGESVLGQSLSVCLNESDLRCCKGETE